jgi:hypothetical protein
MDSFKRLFAPKILKKTQSNLQIKDSPNISQINVADENPIDVDLNNTTPFINIKRHKINIKYYQSPIETPAESPLFDDNELEIKSGCAFSSSSPSKPKFSNNFLSDHQVSDRDSDSHLAKIITSVIKNEIVDISYETKIVLGNLSEPPIPNNEDKHDILVRIKRILHKYDRILLSIDSRVENLHNSLLSELIEISKDKVIVS